MFLFVLGGIFGVLIAIMALCIICPPIGTFVLALILPRKWFE